MLNLGTVAPGTVIYIPYDTFDGGTGASITQTGLAVTDIEIYKDGSMTQRGSDNGYTLLDTDGIDLDGVTGIQGFSVDLADNSTAGFYAAGSRYWVVVSSITVDAQTVNFVAAYFTIGYVGAVNTTIATLASQTSFTLTNGPAEDDALNGCTCVIHDVASAIQMGFAVVLDYTGSTKTVTLTAGTTFTAAATDNLSFYPPVNTRWFAALSSVALPLVPTVPGRSLGVEAGGRVGLDFSNTLLPDGPVIELGILEGGTAQSASSTTLVGRAAATNDIVRSGMILSAFGSTQGYVQTVFIDSVSGDTFTITAWPITTPSGTITYRVFGVPAASPALVPEVRVIEMAANTLTASALASDAVTEIQSGLATAATLGSAGAGLTAIPWNAAWDAEVQSDVDDALVNHRLDELLNADSDIDGAAPPTVGSVFHELLTKTTGSFTYDQTTDSLEAVRDRGDAAWITATGFSTLDAAGVRSAVGLASANLDTQLADIAASANAAATPAEVNAEVVDALSVDTYAESASVVAATATIASSLTWLKTLSRNRLTTTSGVMTLRNAGNTADIATSAVSEDAGTTIRGVFT